jgi:hypothetical protein
LDILVDPVPGATLFDLGGLQVALEDLLGIRVYLLTPGDLPQRLLRSQAQSMALLEGVFQWPKPPSRKKERPPYDGLSPLLIIVGSTI